MLLVQWVVLHEVVFFSGGVEHKEQRRKWNGRHCTSSVAQVAPPKHTDFEPIADRTVQTDVSLVFEVQLVYMYALCMYIRMYMYAHVCVCIMVSL